MLSQLAKNFSQGGKTYRMTGLQGTERLKQVMERPKQVMERPPLVMELQHIAPHTTLSRVTAEVVAKESISNRLKSQYQTSICPIPLTSKQECYAPRAGLLPVCSMPRLES